MFQHCGNAKKFQRIMLICSVIFHNAGLLITSTATSFDL